MAEIRSHRDLVVWQKAMDLAVEVYRLSRGFPHDELYRLTSQLTRAIISVPANVAEGHARVTAKDYAHFLAIAKGSSVEAETFLLLAIRLGYINEANASLSLSLCTEIGKMLTTIRLKLVGKP
jgi:four helix bundle protein